MSYDPTLMREWRDGFYHGLLLGAVVSFLLTMTAWIAA